MPEESEIEGSRRVPLTADPAEMPAADAPTTAADHRVWPGALAVTAVAALIAWIRMPTAVAGWLYAEDGRTFIGDWFRADPPIKVLWMPYAGYQHLIPRLASGLVIAMCVAAVVVTAPGVAVGAPKMFRPSFLAAGAGIGLLSSVIPYWLELEALRRIPTSLFGVWMSVQPAVAALIGLAVLSQHLSPAEWAGICCVVAASAGAAGAAGSTRAPDRPAGNVTPQVPD